MSRIVTLRAGGVQLSTDPGLLVVVPNDGGMVQPVIEGALYIDGVQQPDAVFLAKAFDRPGEVDCYGTDGSTDTRMLITGAQQGRARIVGTCGEESAELPITVYSSFAFTGWRGVLITMAGHTPLPGLNPAGATVFYDAAEGKLKIMVPSYQVGVWNGLSGLEDFAAIKAGDADLLAAGAIGNILDYSAAGRTCPIFICALPGGGYAKIVHTAAGLVWDAQVELSFM